MNATEAPSLLLVATSAGYFVVAAILLRRWQREALPAGAPGEELPPVTFFRPLKAGVPELVEKLTVLVRSMRSGDQLLIGVESGSAEWVVADEVRRAYAEREIVVVTCVSGGARNPKIAKLVQMEAHARHEHWILSDSEAVTDTDFLTAFRCEWTGCDVLTAGYRFARAATWPQRLDAAAVLLTLWPGLAVLRAAGRVSLTLGACTGFRRADLQAVGGWREFGDDLAEDNRMGRALAAAGRTIRLSRSIVTLECDPLSWRDYWRHQRRVAVTYRVANPAGFAGAIFTQGVTIGLLWGLFQPASTAAWLGFASVFVVRWLTARRVAKGLGFPLARLALVVLVASVVETACWVLSWGARSVWWAGMRRRISWAGRFVGDGAR